MIGFGVTRPFSDPAADATVVRRSFGDLRVGISKLQRDRRKR